MFGGRDSLGSAAPRGDTWVWDGKVWTQRQDIGPPGRSGHAVVFDTVRQRVMLFGGEIAGAVVGDTWELTERPETDFGFKF